MADDAVLDTIETHVAMLMRLGEATRRATELNPHRALDRSAYVILRLLQAEGPLNVSALAHRLNLDGSTVTRQVTALERDGLVQRTPDPRDGRGTVIAPTVEGLAKVDAVRRARREVYDVVLEDWSARDRAALAAVLERLTRTFDGYLRQSEGGGRPGGDESRPAAGTGQVEEATSSGVVRALSRRGSPSSAK